MVSKSAFSQSYNISLKVIQVSHNYDCCDDGGLPCFTNSKPEPRYRIRGRYGTSASPGTYSSIKTIDPGNDVACGNISRNDVIFSASAVAADQLQVEVEMWEDDCGSDVTYSSGCDDSRTFVSPVYTFSFLGQGTTVFSVNGSGGYSVKFEAVITGLPEIELKHGNTIIADGDTSPNVSDSTDFGTIKTSGGTNTVPYTIKNVGAADLVLSGSPFVSIGGTNASDFSVISQPSNGTIAPGDSATFLVQFDPGKTGPRNAQINIASNDADEDPYTFNIQGSGYTPCTGMQTIQAGNATTTSSSNTITPFTTFFEDGRTQLLVLASEFTGLNSCSDSLYGMAFNITSANTLSSNITIGLKATTATAFSSFSFESGFTQVFSGSHTPSTGWDMIDFDRGFAWNGSDNLIIEYCYDNSTFNGNSSVEYSTLSFTANRYAYTDGSNGCTLSSFGSNKDRPNIRFRFGAVPEIEVSGNNLEIVNGDALPSTSDSTSFGSHSLGSQTTTAFYIKNTGSTTLNLTGSPLITLNGANTSDFSVSQLPSSSISPGDSAAFKITFSPQAEGLRSARVSIANDDADENPYTFDVSGTGTCKIALSANPTHVTCNSEDDGKVSLNITGGTAPYTHSAAVLQNNLGAPLNKTLYDSVNMNVLQTSTGLRLIPTSSTATFLTKEKFKFQQGLTFEGSIFLPDSGYRVIMVGLNDGSAVSSTSVTKGIYFSEFGKTGNTNLYAINNGSGSQFPTSSYSTNSAGDWYDVKISIGNAEATYYIKKSSENNYSNSKTLSFTTSPDSVKIGVYASKSSGAAGFSIHKDWNLYYDNPDTVNLAPGNYTYYITDALGCSASSSTTITEPTLLTATARVDSTAKCNGFSDAGASVSASGGTAPYSYAWSNSATVPSITSVTAGTYDVVVSDANSCEVRRSVTITQPSLLTATIKVDSNVTCNGDSDGGASLVASGGITPYSYSWSNNTAKAAISGVPAGTYTATITDSNNCMQVRSVSITEPDPFTPTVRVDSNVSCFGLSDGKASVHSSGDGLRISEVNLGSPDYIEIMNVGNGTVDISGMKVVVSSSYSNINSSNSTTWNLSGTMPSKAIDYREDVTGSKYWGNNIFWNSGSKSWAMIIDSTGGIIDAIFWGWSTTDINNFSTTVAGKTVTTSGAWTGNGLNASCGNAFIRTGGSDNDNTGDWLCTSTSKGTQNTGLSLPFPGLSPRTPASYLWSNSATTPSISGLSVGEYSVIVSDSLGCTSKDTITITQPDTLIANLVVDSNESCAGRMDAGATVSVSGGTTPYTYSWNNKASTPSISGIGAGNYEVSIIDANKCSSKKSATIEAPSISIGSLSAVSSICIGSIPQKITENRPTTGSGGSYLYTWQDSTSGQSWRNIKGANSKEYQPSALAKTTWFRRIDSAIVGCVVDTTNGIEIRVHPKPAADFEFNAACEDEQVQFIDSSSANGANIVAYNWSFGNISSSTQRNPVNVYKSTGNYTVSLTITTDSSCTNTVSKTVEVSPVPVADFSVNNVCATDSAFFKNTSTISLGSNTYAWDFGDSSSSTQIHPKHQFQLDGYYRISLTATSDKGCQNTQSTTLQVHELPIAAFAGNSVCLNDSMSFENNSQGAKSYLWNFGDRSSSVTAIPKHLYARNGNYLVSLVAISDKGCLDTLEKQVKVHSLPKASFSAGTTCFLDTTKFTNTSTNATGYTWDLGDGSSSILSEPFRVYGKSGSFNVSLIASSSNGCKDTVFNTVTVNAPPKISFTVTDTCKGMAVSTTNTTSGASSYSWNYGDGNGSTVASPSHTYTSSGLYKVKLVATSSNGCKDSATSSVNIYPLPQVSFSQSNVCDGSPMLFSNKSSIGSGANSYTWNFGDGNTSSNNSPKHTYTTDGNYTAQLIATSNVGCMDSVSKLVKVYALPKPAFNVTNECLNDTFTFKNNTIGATSQTWSFGDATNSNVLSPKHTYGTSGFYTVTLIAKNSNSCVDSLSKKVQAYAMPSAQFTVSAVCLHDSMAFNNNSLGATTYNWNFGDKFVSTSSSPKHLYTNPGRYMASLIARTSNGCADTFEKQVIVHSLPVAAFKGTTSCFTDTTKFNNSSTGASNYLWDMGDGSSSILTEPSKVYGKPASFIVRLIASSSNNCKDTVAHTVVVNSLPSVSFSLNDTCDGKAVTMVNQTTGAASYQWNYGDGNGSNSSDPSHTYSTNGSYNVKLLATSSMGCKDSLNKSISIHPLPQIGFNQNDVCYGKSMTFSNKTVISSGVNSYKWSFGDGTTSNNVSPIHQYGNSGNYTVKLIAASGYGCRDSLSSTVTVYALPTPAFSVNNECLSDTFKFQNNSTGAISQKWSFGDATGSSSSAPLHQYSTPGFYTATLIVASKDKCIDSLSKRVQAYPMPIAQFTAKGICDNDSMSFDNNSQGADTYTWEFGDRSKSTAIAPKHLYSGHGSYPVTLIAASGNGCRDTLEKQVNVYALPGPAFSASTVCFSDSTTFTNNSTGASSYDWDMGDGSGSTLSEPSLVYGKAGSYKVRLLAISSDGCKDTVSNTVAVNALPTVRFSIGDTCRGKAISIDNNTLGANSYSWTYGDGNGSKNTSPSHTYSTDGSYSVQLIATSSEGCKDSASTTISIHPLPQVSFSQNNVCDGKTMAFSNKSAISSGVNSYKWSFGDNKTSGNTSPSHQYASDGNYTVKLIATSAYGCQDSSSSTVTVYPLPKPSFSAGNECLSDDFTFNNSSKGASVYNWNFGDAANSTSSSPTHKYSASGYYTVVLTATSANNCVDSVSRNIQVYEMPVASFGFTNACDKDSIVFTNGSQKASVNAWSFGDTKTSTSQAPKHLYPTDGTYSVRLVASTDKGCRDTSIQNITVYRLPMASFSASSVCDGKTTSFTNSSTLLHKSTWTFGDTKGSSVENPSHTYGSAGTYTTTLIAETREGCLDTTSNTVIVHSLPAPDFSLSHVCFGDTVKFLNNSTGAASHHWLFGDGTGANSMNTRHLYSQDGKYEVRLTATSSNNCVDSISKEVAVYKKPIAAFSNDSTCLGGGILFSNTSHYGDINKHEWTFGDQNSSGLVNVRHQYASHGSYNVTLTVTTDQGCKDTARSVAVVHPKPLAKFSSVNVCAYDTMKFNNLSSLATGTIVSQQWKLGDGNTQTTENASHHYGKPGNYNVGLTIISDKGCSASYDSLMEVFVLPNAAFAVADHCYGRAADFSNLSEISVGGIDTYEWGFGDAEVSNAENPSHQYKSNGIYNSQLVIASDKGCLDTVKKVVEVFEKPVASFIAPAVCHNAVTQFRNTSTGDIEWLWDFGDAEGFSGLQEPKHDYLNPGTYDVSLKVVSKDGCKDTIVQQVEVHALPTANFRVSNHCLFEDMEPEDASLGGINSWDWKFGDGQSESGPAPIHQYLKDGDYLIHLQVTDDNGCIDSVQRKVVVHPLPVLGIHNDTLVSKGYEVKLWATGGVKYQWTPDNGLFKSNSRQPLAIVTEDITYTVTVSTAYGCVKDTFVNIRVEEDYTMEPSNVLTPDGNGQNDYWIVEKATYYDNIEVIVFDRWGRIVYQSASYANNWDGTVNGKPLPDGAYYYIINVPGERQDYKGSITIFR